MARGIAISGVGQSGSDPAKEVVNLTLRGDECSGCGGGQVRTPLAIRARSSNSFVYSRSWFYSRQFVCLQLMLLHH